VLLVGKLVGLRERRVNFGGHEGRKERRGLHMIGPRREEVKVCGFGLVGIASLGAALVGEIWESGWGSGRGSGRGRMEAV
jgi:hypothetical protein